MSILRTEEWRWAIAEALIENITLQVPGGDPDPHRAQWLREVHHLKSMIRQLNLLAGTVYLADGICSMAERELARSISVVMTDRVHPELMTCADVVATGRYPYTGSLGLLSQGDWAAVRSAMERVDALGLWDTDFGQLSDGQRQRILLARAICQEPEVMVLDEPTSFLDIRYKLELLAILKDLVRDKGMAAVVSLHELDLAQKISDTVVCVSPERGIDRWGPPEEIFAGDYIHRLYGVTRGSFDPLYGSLELERPSGRPQVFVIGGGGSGIPVYRRLQRRGVPFAAGILQENDLDYPVAAALAAEVVSQGAFQPVGEDTFRRALAALEGCPRAVCCLESFGPSTTATAVWPRPPEGSWSPGGDLTGGLPGEKGKKRRRVWDLLVPHPCVL